MSDKDDIQNELDHINKLLKIAHDNRRALETQQIQQGMIAPLNLINQINEVKNSILELEERKNQLEIQSVETDYTLAEAEYNLAVADSWQEGYISPKSKIALELLRLKLQIPPKRASEIEKQIRSEIVVFLFKKIDFHKLFNLPSFIPSNESTNNEIYIHFYEGSTNNGTFTIDQSINTINSTYDNFRKLSNCIITEKDTVITILGNFIKFEKVTNIDFFEQNLLQLNYSSAFQENKILYEDVIRLLQHTVISKT